MFVRPSMHNVSTLPLAHPCNRVGSHRESLLSQTMERNQCRARGQQVAFIGMAAEVIDVLVTKGLTGSTLTRQEAEDARRVARNLRSRL